LGQRRLFRNPIDYEPVQHWPTHMKSPVSVGARKAARERRQIPGPPFFPFGWTLDAPKRINLQIDQSELVTGQLGRDRKISVTRDGVVVTFSRDARGKASLCVEGQGHSEESLRAMGEELSKRVVQKYVYQRLMSEMQQHQFCVVEEETTADNSIRMKVRRWEN